MTDKYAVIGNPIAHSKSPQIHKMFAEQTGEDISYEAIFAPLDDFAETIERLRKEGYKGCNVTVPFKLQASNLTTYLSTEVTDANAANTLAFDGEIIKADNTDGTGLVRDIEHNLRIILQGKRVLLMGAGGAARGVQMPLIRSGIQRLDIANRSPGKAEEMLIHGHRFISDQFNVTIDAKSYSDLGGEQFDIIINATSSGLSDENPLQKDVGNIFAPGALAYDMMYGRETPFMKFAREHGAVVVSDGLGMLVEQAAESFRIWRGRNLNLDTAAVIKALRVKQ
jgi:shikimate dehydrogenase